MPDYYRALNKEDKMSPKTESFYLPFERPIQDLEKQIHELEEKSAQLEEVAHLRETLERLKDEVFTKLSPWERVLVARHPQRPQTLDYIEAIFDEFIEMHGDRRFAEDPCIVAGVARIGGRPVVLIGQHKGRNLDERMKYRFGCANPEGYRKALLKMKMAEKFGLPIVTLIDTPGAYPGIGAEERGQAQAIAENLMEMAVLKTPIIGCVIGEGGSGGALGIGVTNRLAILENAYYSVISPEGCAAILWRDGAKAPEAAEALKLTPGELLKYGIVDDVIREPFGGAHRQPAATAENLKKQFLAYLDELAEKTVDELLDDRYNKVRQVGVYEEAVRADAQNAAGR